MEDAPDIKSGYSLQFRFAQNPFFSNAVLEKRCAFYDDGTAEITGTQPDWYPGKVAPFYDASLLAAVLRTHLRWCATSSAASGHAGRI